MMLGAVIAAFGLGAIAGVVLGIAIGAWLVTVDPPP